MTNAEVLNLMMSRLGERRATTLRANVLLELNNKIYDLDQGPTIPWFLSTRAEGNLIANQDWCPVPEGFAREVEGRFRLQMQDQSSWIKLVKVSLEELEEQTENVNASFPEGYALDGDRFYFGPKPNYAYPYRIQIYKHSVKITDTAAPVVNPWLLEFFNYTTLSALAVVARLHVHSDKITQEVNSELQVAADMFFKAVEAREHVNRKYLLGNTEN